MGAAPYALMVFAGMLPWTFFSTGLADASNSLISNANLISKVYFPRLIVPVATIAVAFVDFLISFLHFDRADGLVPIPSGTGRSSFLPAIRAPGILGQLGPVSVDHRA